MATPAAKLQPVVSLASYIRGRIYLTEWRDHYHLSAEDLGKRIRVSRQTIFRYEKNQRKLTPEKLLRLADAIGIEPWQFWFPPSFPSADALLKNATLAQREMAVAYVKGMLGR